jgi:hypothetical protein
MLSTNYEYKQYADALGEKIRSLMDEQIAKTQHNVSDALARLEKQTSKALSQFIESSSRSNIANNA